ncbi:MAG: DNA/RNA non-specific endonuclease [Phocaeicola sp.]|uniref:DNA/RNA non-specific endonuclease n=1 Tax=Phocaeicola sp. TaxID=2773926 RepID=UPI003F9F2D17
MNKKKSSLLGSMVILIAMLLVVYQNYNKQTTNINAKEEKLTDQLTSDTLNTKFWEPENTSMTKKPTYSVDKMEIPVVYHYTGGERMDRMGYTIYYDPEFKTPRWVAWEVTRNEAKSDNAQRSTEFTPDPNIKGSKVFSQDYTRSGYDRGHMAPAGDMKWSSKSEEETFYMTNICPQNHELNKGDWNDLEIQTRYWAKKYGKVWVCCGPIYKTKNPKRIGTHKVAVPDAFFKVVLFNKGKDNPVCVGFLFDNNASHKKMKDRAVSVDSVESLIGMDFFSYMPDEIENRIETKIPDIFH